MAGAALLGERGEPSKPGWGDSPPHASGDSPHPAPLRRYRSELCYPPHPGEGTVPTEPSLTRLLSPHLGVTHQPTHPPTAVIPAQAGIQTGPSDSRELSPRFLPRGNDTVDDLCSNARERRACSPPNRPDGLANIP